MEQVGPEAEGEAALEATRADLLAQGANPDTLDQHLTPAILQKKLTAVSRKIRDMERLNGGSREEIMARVFAGFYYVHSDVELQPWSFKPLRRTLP